MSKRKALAQSVVSRRMPAALGVVVPKDEQPAGATPEELVAEYVPCVLDGVLYKLKCTWQALKIASLELRKQGVPCNLMQGLDFRYSGPETVAPLFFAMAYAQHPGLKYATVDEAIGMDNALHAFDAVATAYVLGMPKAEKGSKANPSSDQAQL